MSEHTLVDIPKKFQNRFRLKNRPIVVADKGMLSNANIAFLENNNKAIINCKNQKKMI